MRAWAFNQAGLTAAGVWNAFGADDAVRASFVNYLRGDQSNEGTGTGQFRVRSARLGDIVNSDIVFAGRENFGYQNLSPDNFDANNINTNSYGRVRARQAVSPEDDLRWRQRRNASRLRRRVDGRAVRLCSALGAGGDGVRNGCTAVDRAVGDQTYNGSHRFFVDGSPWVGDACLKSPASNCTVSDWRTVLVGTTGAAAKGCLHST